MKKALNYFASILASFKWYRKKKGGDWYYVELIGSAAGVSGPVEYWIQRTPDEDEEIIKTENY